MNCQGRRFGSLLLLLLLSACGKAPVQGWASFPVPIYSSSALSRSAAMQSDFEDAMRFWEEKAGQKLFAYQGTWDESKSPYTGSADSPGSILANVIFFQNPWPFPESAVGETTVKSTEDGIIGALVMINPSINFCSGDCKGDNFSISERKTFTHELGHFLGLGHVQDINNIMYPNTVPGGSLASVQVDVAALKTLVSPKD